MDRAASVLPYLPPAELDAVVRAVLAEADDYVGEQEAVTYTDDGLPPDLPAWGWKPVEALVGPDPVWDTRAQAWAVVAANPIVDIGDEQLVTFEGGVIAPYTRGAALPVAHDLGAAMAWNRRHAPVGLVDDLDEEERGWQQLHTEPPDDWRAA
jgi:hypothetical protein